MGFGIRRENSDSQAKSLGAWEPPGPPGPKPRERPERPSRFHPGGKEPVFFKAQILHIVLKKNLKTPLGGRNLSSARNSLEGLAPAKCLGAGGGLCALGISTAQPSGGGLL